MAAKLYGYAESDADVEALRAYAAMDIIFEDMATMVSTIFCGGFCVRAIRLSWRIGRR